MFQSGESIPWCQEVGPFDSAKQFLEFLIEKQHDEKDQSVGIPPTLFRGQENANWPLAPRVFRQDFDWGAHFVRAFTLKFPQVSDRSSKEYYLDRGSELGTWMGQEVRVVGEFLGAADTLGLLPHVNFTLLESTSREYIARVFQAYPGLPELGPYPPLNLLDYFALAQHCGVPTRLLDWTESPAIAAFFAAYKAWAFRAIYEASLTRRLEGGELYPQDPPEVAADAFLAVFAIRSYQLRIAGLSSGPIEVFKTSRSTNEFIRAQRGVFINMPLVNDYYRLEGRWPTLSHYLEKDHPQPIAFKVTLHASHSSKLLRLLSKQGVAPSSVFPTLSNAAQHSWYLRVLEHAF